MGPLQGSSQKHFYRDVERNGRNDQSNLAFPLDSLADGEAVRHEDTATQWGAAGGDNPSASHAAFPKAGSDSGSSTQASACSTDIII